MSSFDKFLIWIRGQMHVSWHIAAVSFGVLLGVIAAPAADNAFGSPFLLITCAALLLFCLRKRFRYVVVFVFCFGIIFGLWRGGAQYADLKAYTRYYDKNVTVIGRSIEDSSFGPKGDQRLRIGSVRIGSSDLPGTVWVSTESHQTVKRGDVIVVKGELSQGFGTIPASMFRAEVVAAAYPDNGDIGREARDWFAKGVERVLSKEDAQLALAYLVGQKITAADALNEQLKIVGLIHAVVASGAHLTILVGAIRRLFVGVSKYLTAISSLALVAGFILITGFSPSMTRAGLVSALSLLAWYYGRVIHPLVLLPFVAAVTVLYNPSYVWGDVGWYLSFAAFTGIVILAPLLHHYFWGGDKAPGVLREILVATIAASLTTLPITAAVFGYYSPYALLANLLIIPLVPLTMLLTFLVGLLGLTVPFAAQWVSLPLGIVLEYMKSVVNFLAHAPGAQQEVSMSRQMILLSYGVIAGLIIGLYVKTGHNFRRDSKLAKDF